MRRQMVAHLPFEIIDHIVGYLDFGDVRSIARVCSAFQLPARLRLFKTIQTLSYNDYPNTESILSFPHLLQYASRFVVESYGSSQQFSVHSLWFHLPMMHRLISMEICLDPSECSRALSALESLGSGREITLVVRIGLADLLISDDPLPVHTLKLFVHASNHQGVTRLVQKCSQSLRILTLILEDSTIPSLPFLPHLNEFSVNAYLYVTGLLVSLYPFLYQHPTITRLVLGYLFALAVQPPPNLLPNLQFLEADPMIIQYLIPGRPVNRIRAEYFSIFGGLFPSDIMLRPLRQPFVSVTTFAIITGVHLPNDLLINIVQALPKLRKFTVDWPCREGSVALQGLLPALGKCKNMVHIRLYPSECRISPSWSRSNFVQMVQRIQENGAADLWIFAIDFRRIVRQEGCEAIRVGWLDVPSQPTLRGEWRFYGKEPSSFSDIPMSV